MCTSYLSSLKSGALAPLFFPPLYNVRPPTHAVLCVLGTTLLLGLQKGLLSLPPSPSIPTICVGPGTGIAPMRALIGRRVRQGARGKLLWFYTLSISPPSSSLRYDEDMQEIDCGFFCDPENTLYFGCRSQDKDQHYGQEWERLSQTSVPPPYLTYRPAFSRDNPEGVKRTYVQDLMDEDREKVWDVVGRRGGWVYISGCVVFYPVPRFFCILAPKDSHSCCDFHVWYVFASGVASYSSANKMPAAVRKSIADAARVCGELGEDEAKEYVERVGREGRLWEECWS